MKKILRSLIAVVLVFSMVANANPGFLGFAADEPAGTLYVKDVQIFQASTLDECVKLCEEVGYKPYKRNLNDGAVEKVSFGSDVDAPCVMLGYTTTTNVNQAVTDLSLLRMGEGYEMREYQAIAAALLAKNQNYAEGLAAAASDFAENYDKGAPSAVQAYKMLDLMYVDDLEAHSMSSFTVKKGNGTSFTEMLKSSRLINDYLKGGEDNPYKDFDWMEHTPLSEFILEGNADAAFFGKLLSFGTPGIVSAVTSALCTASAEYENYYNPETDRYETVVWAQRIFDSDIRVMISEGLTSDEWRSFDSAYMDTARLIASSIQEFATQYLNAKARGSRIESLGSTDADDLDGVVDEMNGLTDSDLDGVYIAAYEILNRFRYDDSRMLGDWIVSAGRRSYATEEDYRTLYVLADVLSPAQLIMLKYCGFCTFVNKMLQPDEESPESDEAFRTIIDGLKRLVKKGEEYRVPVWLGVDNALYYGKVAMTSDAIRQSGANAALQPTQAEKDAENDALRQKYLAIGSGVISLLSIVANLAIYIKGASLIKAGVTTGVAAAGGFWAFLTSATSFVTKVNLILLAIEIVVTIAIAIYKLVRNELHVPSSEYTDMPSLLFDSKTTPAGVRVVKYNAVMEPYRGRIGDLNAYAGYKWNLIYMTRDEDAGSPIVVPEGEEPFLFKQNDSATPEGYEPLSQFGQSSAADMNSGEYDLRNGEKNFLFYATVRSQSGNTGESVSAGKYIGDLKAFTADTVERCKAKITTAAGNYQAFDYNLGTGEEPCYIGYSLTDRESSAVTDIRFFAGENASSITYGGAEYTLSGELPSGGGIYISRSSLVGTPIGAELACIKSPENAPAGWEPIVHFSGTPVKLFGSGNDSFAIYFEPKVKYTEGELYVGGFAFYQADYAYARYTGDRNKERKSSVNDMLSVLRWQKGGIAMDPAGHKAGDAIPDTANMTRADVERAVNLCSEMSFIRSRRGTAIDEVNVPQLYLIYALTYNPYRAIRDVALYSSATANDKGLFTTLSKEILYVQNGVEKKTVGGYAVCDDHFTKSAETVQSSGPVRSSHAYISTEIWNGYVYAPGDDAPARDDGGVYAWENARLSMRGLYVLGPVEGLEPLKAADVVLSPIGSDAKNDDGNIYTRLPEGSFDLLGESAADRVFHSVQDIKYPYNETAQNLSNPAQGMLSDRSVKASEPLYMYLAGNVHKPRYISGVTVGTYTEAQFKNENPSADSSTVNYMNALSEDIAWRSALAGSDSGIVPVNLLAPEGEAWNTAIGDEKTGLASAEYAPNCSYIGISRTDDPSRAITGALLVKKEAVQPGSAPITQIVVGGVSSIAASGSAGTGTTYYLVQGSNAVPLKDGEYYLYYSYNPAAVPGVPVTDIDVDGAAFANGMSTVLSSNERGKEAKLFGNANVENYIHMKYDYTQGSLFTAFYIGTGENPDAAYLDLLAQGAVEAAAVDINLGAGGAVVLGWRTMTVTDEDIALHERSKGKSSDPLREAVRDLILTVDEPYRETLIHNGVVYKPVGKKSFNGGVEGSEIYLYTCTDYDTWAYNLGKPATEQLYCPSMYSDFASPLSRIGLAKGDRVPYNTRLQGTGDGADLVVWENVLTTYGEKADLNRGALLTTPDGLKLLENRVYLFVHRADNVVKKGAEITGGFVSDTEPVGPMYGQYETKG